VSYIVMNVITVPPERAGEFEERFAKRAAQVSSSPGFEAFELMRPADDRTQYIVYTRWDAKESFEAWVGSPAFSAGHRQHSESGPVGTASEMWAFEVIQGEYAGEAG
jgi:heme-degrading monooxygenase HmoA